MLAALLRYPKSERRRKAQDWNKLGQLKRAENRIKCGPSFEDIIARAKFDRKGELLREGVTFKGGTEIKWQIKYSLGATNQFDVFVNNKLWATGGRRKLRELGCPIKF